MAVILYSAGEIVQKLRGVTTRQILDLAEKGLITPARETTGAGSARLYDFQNVFEICLCLAIRGRIPAGTATKELISNVLKFVRDETADAQKIKADDPGNIILKRAQEAAKAAGLPFLKTFAPPPFDVLFIAYDNKDNYKFDASFNDKTLKTLLASSKKYRPQNYCTYIIEVLPLWTYLKGIF